MKESPLRKKKIEIECKTRISWEHQERERERREKEATAAATLLTPGSRETPLESTDSKKSSQINWSLILTHSLIPSSLFSIKKSREESRSRFSRKKGINELPLTPLACSSLLNLDFLVYIPAFSCFSLWFRSILY